MYDIAVCRVRVFRDGRDGRDGRHGSRHRWQRWPVFVYDPILDRNIGRDGRPDRLHRFYPILDRNIGSDGRHDSLQRFFLYESDSSSDSSSNPWAGLE